MVNYKVNSKQCTLHSLKRSFKFFEERGVQKSVFQNYLKTTQIAENGDYGKMFHGKSWEPKNNV